MKKTIFLLGMLALGLSATHALAAKVGEKAPDFKGRDSHGKIRRLSDNLGKFVVLEWHNHDCPFTQSQYKGKMQKLQQEWTQKGVVWFQVISSAPGKDGYVTPKKANLDASRNGAAPTAILLDPTGLIGHAYGAKTTPHLFIIDPKGILIYDGAVDNAPLEDEWPGQTKDGKPYLNYVDQALKESMSGREVSVKTTVPYGCSVKY